MGVNCVYKVKGIVVGGGLAGISAANTFSENGAKALVFFLSEGLNLHGNNLEQFEAVKLDTELARSVCGVGNYVAVTYCSVWYVRWHGKKTSARGAEKG